LSARIFRLQTAEREWSRGLSAGTPSIAAFVSPERVGAPALTPEQREQNDDGQRDTQQPQQNASTETHDLLQFSCRRLNARRRLGFHAVNRMQGAAD
jgi:hypothetical protein